LTSSRQIISAARSCLPFGATAPVSAMLKPTLIGALIGSLIGSWARAPLVAASMSTTHAASRRSAAVTFITMLFSSRRRPSMGPSFAL
jgi:hypothetical protein